MQVLFLMMEVISLAIALFLSGYSHHRMGLNRHFIFEHYRFESFAEDFPIKYLMCILFILYLIFLFVLFIKKKNSLSLYGYIHASLIVLLAVVGLFCLSPWRDQLMIYPYLLFVLPILLLFNCFGLYFDSKKNQAS